MDAPRTNRPVQRPPSPTPRASMWDALLKARTPEDAVRRLAQTLGRAVRAIELDEVGASARTLASWGDGDRVAETARIRTLEIDGEPRWTLTVVLGAGGDDAVAERARSSLEAWRHVRAALDRAEARLDGRTRELGLLQALGQAAAAAHGLEELFRSAVEVLQGGEGIDAALVAHRDESGATSVTAYLGRPLSPHCLAELQRRATGLLGWSEPPPMTSVPLDIFDATREPRDRFDDEHVVLLPLLRRGRPEACLVVMHDGPPRDARVRLLYGANNQLSLHHDRIVTMREAEEDRFRAIVDSLPLGVLVIDAAGAVVQANRAAERMLGEAGLAGLGSADPLVERLQLGTTLDDVRAGRRVLAETEATLADGAIWSATVAPFAGPGASGARVVLVMNDVTEQRRLQLQLTQSEKMSSLGQMISGVAHELNNPLASIVGFAQLVRVAADSGKTPERLEIIAREAERCRRIVRSLLSFARRHEPERAPLSLNQVVRDVANLLRYQLRSDGVTLDERVDNNLPPIDGDSHQLQQLLVNLVMNAHQAIRQNRSAGTIRIVTQRGEGGGAILRVDDDGPGVPHEIRRRIFDPFYTTKPVGQGTGLGLSLAYGIISGHGGTIDVGRADGGGARFELCFPGLALRAGATPVPEAGAAERGAAIAPARVLVVDDERHVADVICEALEADGHHAVRELDGCAALERVEREAFDLVVTDLRQPGTLDGRPLFELLLERRPGLRGRLLVTTGASLAVAETARMVERGAGLLHKPFDLAELRAAIDIRLRAGDGR